MTDSLRSFAEWIVSLDGLNADAVKARQNVTLDQVIASARTAITNAPKPTFSARSHECPEHPGQIAWDCTPCRTAAAADPSDHIARVKAIAAEAKARR